MLYTLRTVKMYGNVMETSGSRFIHRIIKGISAFIQFYGTCPEGLHLRHYVDPITGRAVPAPKRNK